MSAVCLADVPLPLNASAQNTVAQLIFIGDRTCKDVIDDCSFAPVEAHHRFLHIVLHDVPRSYDWQVLAGPTCAGTEKVAGGGIVGSDGYLETVVDLGQLSTSLASAPTCYIFRGADGWYARFYAAYFDDNPLPDADDVYPGFRSLDGKPDLPDLDVAYISRTPLLDYDAPKHVPNVGDTIRYEGHVVNSGPQSSGAFTYEWLVNGRSVAHGSITGALGSGGSTVVALSRRWMLRPEVVTLRIVPSMPDMSANNNQLTVSSSALGLGFWVEQGAYRYFRGHQWHFCQPLACSGSTSLEDWLQRQTAAWNGILAGSAFANMAPSGAADRIRVDKIVVVPDGTLPLNGGAATNSPDRSDHSVDLQWGLPAKAVDTTYPLRPTGGFNVDWAMIHELNHARSLSDLYRFDVPLRSDNRIDVVNAQGKSVVDVANPHSALASLPAFFDDHGQSFLYKDQEQDLMSCVCIPRYSLYTVLTLNRIHGLRARCGNINPPCNMGDWFADMPPLVRLKVLDAGGSTAPDGTVIRLFFDSGKSYAGHTFTTTDSLRLILSKGIVTLPSDPFRQTAAAWPPGHNLLLIEIAGAETDAFCFAEPTTFNLSYWIGYRDRQHPATISITTGHGPHNECRLDLPAVRINEPFGTSLFTSKIAVVRKNSMESFAVHLLDDQRPPAGMANRRVTVTNASGQVLSAGRTDGQGRVTIRLPKKSSSYRIRDVTDNSLDLTALLQSPSQKPAPSR